MIDLHSHSTYSDGSESPQHVVELAAEAGCTTIALTDHDGIEGNGAARKRAHELGIEFISGCEVSCTFPTGSMHVLCYFIEPGPGALQDELGRLQDDRTRRNENLIERLQALDLPITSEEVASEAKGTTIGRPHYAAVLVKNGVVRSIDEAFNRYLGKGGLAYISKARLEPSEVFQLVSASGGVAVLAHPLSLGLSGKHLRNTVGELAADGLVGLESYYGRYDPATRNELVRLARQHRLVPTGGSDFHGTYKPDLGVGVGTGDLHVPHEVIEELSARRPTTAASN